MQDKMLMICYRPPFSLISGGLIRMNQFADFLSKQYCLDVIYLQEEKIIHPNSTLEKQCNMTKGFYVKKLRRMIQAIWGYLFHGKPLQVGYFYSKDMQRFIDEHMEEYNAIMCMHIRTASYVLREPPNTIRKKRVYLDGIDAISLNYQNSYKVSKGIRKLVYYVEYRRMKRYEQEVYTKISDVSLISDRDKQYLQNKLGVAQNAALIPMYAVPFERKESVKQYCRTLTFMGKMNYKPNIDAMKHFIECIYPQIQNIYTDVKLQVIGGFATEDLLRYDGKSGVVFLGFLDDPGEELQKSTLVIAPMVSGSGLQTKILQAMQLGCPVVTTQIGADGLEDLSGEEILVAKSDDELLQLLCEYLGDEKREERIALGNKAEEYINHHYSYNHFEKRMKKWMELS